jgi:hypothetical protein
MIRIRPCSMALAAALSAALAAPALASFHEMQIEQVIGGVNGDTSAQAIQLRMRAPGQRFVSQARIRAWDAAGANPVLLLDLTSDVTNASMGDHVLLATQAFAGYTSPTVAPDFILANAIPPSYLAAGRITWEDKAGSIYWSLAFGGIAYTGSTTGVPINDADGDFGPPYGGPLPSGGRQALQFTGLASDLSTSNLAQYALSADPAVFTNNAGAQFTVVGAARVFVSVSGSDANPCSNIATPCRTFGAAINQVAPGGEVIVRSSGSYGGVTIAKAVTVNAPAGIVVFTAQPIVVAAGVLDVVIIRGLTLKAAAPTTSKGLQLVSGKTLSVENCAVSGFLDAGISQDGAGVLQLKDTIVRSVTGAAVQIAPASGAADAVLDHCRLEGSGTGLLVSDRGRATIRNSVVSGNTDGVRAQAGAGAAAEVTVERCTVANNAVNGIVSAGVAAGGLATARVSESVVTSNGIGLSQTTSNSGASALLSRADNTVEGNGTDTSGTIGAFAPR